MFLPTRRYAVFVTYLRYLELIEIKHTLDLKFLDNERTEIIQTSTTLL